MAQSGIATLLGWRGDDPNSLKVPRAPNVDTTQAQKKALEGNLENLPAIAALAAKSDKEYAANFLAMLNQLGLGDMFRKGTETITTGLGGFVPADVENYLKRQGAEMGVSTGTMGSDFNKYGTLRNLGLTSLDIINKSLDSASRWIAAAPKPMDYSQMFVSPSQRIATEQWNEVNRYNTQFLKNQIKMLPSNAEMAGAQILDYVATWATTAASFGTDSIGGGGGGSKGTAPVKQPYSSAESAANMRDHYLNNNYGY